MTKQLKEDKARTAHWLREQGKTFKEIGDILGLTKGRAKQLYDYFVNVINKPLAND